ncbi:CBS domain-containing protein [Pullulanibacillus sp. KACC 23026]|uniref:cyclic-di-AMP-binding protein CbpB n=1 Tax=Pullulanibacillus sp. KACC 23026 TaxID=3028315 RepID=UPI0023B171F7|nr:cyclic-di-AMP-binding protein CbpB [Pullulanibacillus sp. KACC 23026]WEG11775.1 CBS domain-containing protein [Pullulanibacillus sp. KACC 23026]
MKRLKECDVINKNIMDLIIPDEQVAVVQSNNPLEHALLVLVKSGYSAIPVVDIKNKFQGIVSKTMILNHIFGIERIEFEKLSEFKVQDVMKSSVPIVHPDDDFLTVVKLSINEPFLCVVDQEENFKGIIPRSALLKFMNHYLRDISHEVLPVK